MGNMFNAQIFGRRKRGDREEVRLKLFNLDGSPADIDGGGGGLNYAASGSVGVPNDGEDYFPELDTLLPDGSAGVYLAKLNVNWAIINPTSGGASVMLVHIADSDQTETTICIIELNTRHDTMGYGDDQLGPGGSGVKNDIAVVSQDGHFMLRAQQFTDEGPTEVSVDVILVKL